MRRERLVHKFVDFIPERTEDGVLYISHRYKTAVHKCACGCGEEVVTPLTPIDWSICFEDGGVTLDPSIGNWSFACRSHYFVRASRVVWAREIPRADIERGRAFDAKRRERYLDRVNRGKSRSLVRNALDRLRAWWRP